MKTLKIIALSGLFLFETGCDAGFKSLSSVSLASKSMAQSIVKKVKAAVGDGNVADNAYNFQILVDVNQLSLAEAQQSSTFAADGVWAITENTSDMAAGDWVTALQALNGGQWLVSEDNPGGNYEYDILNQYNGKVNQSMNYYEGDNGGYSNTLSPAEIATLAPTHGNSVVVLTRSYGLGDARRAIMNTALANPLVTGAVFETNPNDLDLDSLDMKGFVRAVLSAGKKVYILLPPRISSKSNDYLDDFKATVAYFQKNNLLSNPNVYLVPAIYARAQNNLGFVNGLNGTSDNNSIRAVVQWLKQFRQTGSMDSLITSSSSCSIPADQTSCSIAASSSSFYNPGACIFVNGALLACQGVASSATASVSAAGVMFTLQASSDPASTVLASAFVQGITAAPSVTPVVQQQALVAAAVAPTRAPASAPTSQYTCQLSGSSASVALGAAFSFNLSFGGYVPSATQIYWNGTNNSIQISANQPFGQSNPNQFSAVNDGTQAGSYTRSFTVLDSNNNVICTSNTVAMVLQGATAPAPVAAPAVASVAVSPTLVPIYRLYNPIGDHLYSTNSNEAVSGGYGLDGVAFNLAASSGSDLQALYRCRNGLDHFLSTDGNCEGFTTESVLGYLHQSAIGNPLYRFYNQQSHYHLETTNPAEGYNNGFTLEGVIGYVW